MTPYTAQLSIHCVDGMNEGIVGSDPHRLLRYLKDHDHEGSSISLRVVDEPGAAIREVDDPHEVYRTLEEWVMAVTP